MPTGNIRCLMRLSKPFLSENLFFFCFNLIIRHNIKLVDTDICYLVISMNSFV